MLFVAVWSAIIIWFLLLTPVICSLVLCAPKFVADKSKKWRGSKHIEEDYETKRTPIRRRLAVLDSGFEYVAEGFLYTGKKVLLALIIPFSLLVYLGVVVVGLGTTYVLLWRATIYKYCPYSDDYEKGYSSRDLERNKDVVLSTTKAGPLDTFRFIRSGLNI